MFEVKANKNDSGKVVSLSIKVDGKSYFVVTTKLTGFHSFIAEHDPMFYGANLKDPPKEWGNISMTFENSPEILIVVKSEELDALVAEIEKAMSQSF